MFTEKEITDTVNFFFYGTVLLTFVLGSYNLALFVGSFF